jgi:hypothetical protein
MSNALNGPQNTVALSGFHMTVHPITAIPRRRQTSLILDGADHQGLERLVPLLPPSLVVECTLMRAAMVARSRVCVYVPNRDRAGELIAVGELVPALRSRLRRITGGQTTYHASGDYFPPTGIEMAEETAVLEAFLPRVVGDSVRSQLTALIIDFGYSARQEEVLVTVQGFAYWIATGSLIDAEREAAPQATGAAEGGRV